MARSTSSYAPALFKQEQDSKWTFAILIPLTDPPSLLPRLASRLALLRHDASTGSTGLPDRDPAHGQAQTHLRSVDGLWGLCGRDGLHACVRDREEDGAEAVLQADHAAGGLEEFEYGRDGEEVGRRGGAEEGGEWDATEESAQEAKVGEAEGYVLLCFLLLFFFGSCHLSLHSQ